MSAYRPVESWIGFSYGRGGYGLTKFKPLPEVFDHPLLGRKISITTDPNTITVDSGSFRDF